MQDHDTHIHVQILQSRGELQQQEAPASTVLLARVSGGGGSGGRGAGAHLLCSHASHEHADEILQHILVVVRVVMLCYSSTPQ
jgi:hypothetical protein